MKFFSNFDTKIKSKCIEENVQEYGEENVLCISKSGLYLFIKIIWPLCGAIILDLAFVFFFYYIFAYTYLLPIILVVLVVISPFLFVLIGRYIDYKMDFVVVNPESLVQYDQTGFFMKKLVTINEKSIKTVTVERKGILYSMFDNWDITFFSEWDEIHGDITLHYVANPEKKRLEIEKIMNK